MKTMIINPTLFWQAYKQANETDHVDCMAPKDAKNALSWIAKHTDSSELIGFLTEWPFADDEQLCAHYFFSPCHMMQSTKSAVALKAKYLVIGCTANGDFIVIGRRGAKEVGFVNHETLDNKHSDCEYVAVAESIGEAYFNSWNKAGFPCDYYEALQRRKTQKLTRRRYGAQRASRQRPRVARLKSDEDRRQ